MGTPAMPFFGPGLMADKRQDRSDPRPAAEAAPSGAALEAHMRRMFRLIYRIVGNVPDAQDLTQDAMLKALGRREQLRDDRKAVQWLNRIAVNTALDFVRRRSRVVFEEIETAPPAAAPSPEQDALRSETRMWIEGGLKRLSERERTALLLRDVEQMPAAEVAQVMGCSTATVRSHIANARVKFKRYREETEQ